RVDATRTWGFVVESRADVNALADGSSRRRSTHAGLRRACAGLSEVARSVSDHLHLVVHPLERTVADAHASLGEDTRPAGLDHPGEALHGLKPRAHRPTEPVSEVAFGPPAAHVVPEALELLLQQVGEDDRQVEPAEGGEATALRRLEVPGILQPEEAGALEGGALPAAHGPPGVPAPGVDGVVEVLHDPRRLRGRDRQ